MKNEFVGVLILMKSRVGGYAGKFLRVDLTKEHLSNMVFDESLLRQYLGGTGIGIKILYDEVPPELCWSNPTNRVLIASGPLGGTVFPGSGTISLVKNPDETMTKTWPSKA